MMHFIKPAPLHWCQVHAPRAGCHRQLQQMNSLVQRQMSAAQFSRGACVGRGRQEPADDHVAALVLQPAPRHVQQAHVVAVDGRKRAKQDQHRQRPIMRRECIGLDEFLRRHHTLGQRAGSCGKSTSAMRQARLSSESLRVNKKLDTST